MLDMHEAVNHLRATRPENLVVGPKGSVSYVAPGSEKEAIRLALASAFNRETAWIRTLATEPSRLITARTG
jgi:hypothetical protein